MKKIAVLTSGGDAPGMNAAVRSVVRAGLYNRIEMFAVIGGFKGLVDGEIVQVERNFVKDIINRGGTIIRTARLPEFLDINVQKQAVRQLKKRGIDGLVVIGGDGTYQGGLALTKLGIKCIGVPATIDNDIANTDYTIGFDTCQNTICECVDKLRDTSSSHQRCSLIEVMGRHCGDLALFSGIAEGVEMVISTDNYKSEDKIIADLIKLRDQKKKHAIILIAENITDVRKLAKEIEKVTGLETRAEVLGRLQRGGCPSAFDRILASRMGSKAVHLLMEGINEGCVGFRNGIIDYCSFEEALSMQGKNRDQLVDLLNELK